MPKFEPSVGFRIYIDLEFVSGLWVTLSEAKQEFIDILPNYSGKPHVQIRCEMIVYNDFGDRK